MFSFIVGSLAVAGIKTLVTGGGIDDFFEAVGDIFLS